MNKKNKKSHQKILIIGGVAGGASAATRLRRLSEDAKIIMFEKTEYVSFANCGLPYYIGNVIETKDDLIVKKVKDFQQRFNIDVRTKQEVIEINLKQKFVKVFDYNQKLTYQEDYDKLVLSPGSKPLIPNVMGINDYRVFTIKTINDAENIRSFIKQNKPKTVAIIGGGFIGVEMAENLSNLNIDVSIIEMRNQILPQLDYEMACLVHNKLKENKINLLLNSKLKQIKVTKTKLNVFLKTNNQDNQYKNIEFDFVILAIGVVPDTQLAKNCGLKLNNENAIIVNQKLQTSNKNVYAIGDAITTKDFIFHSSNYIPLAGPANKQGRIVANNICNIKTKYHGTQNSTIIKIFDLVIGSTGVNEKKAKQHNVRFEKSFNNISNHPSYYPNSKKMWIKIIYNQKTLKILGAQIIGYEGVDKRIDIIATLIRQKAKIKSLAELELCYAPPFNSAKDPVNIAGFILENVSNKIVNLFHWHDVDTIVNNPNNFILDVRNQDEYLNGHFHNAINIPLNNLRSKLDLIPKNKTIYINCQTGARSYLAYMILKAKGYDCFNLSGGYKLYSEVIKNK